MDFLLFFHIQGEIYRQKSQILPFDEPDMIYVIFINQECFHIDEQTMKIAHLVLQVFDQKIGPIIYRSIPDDLSPDIAEYMSKLFDTAEKGFFEHVKEDIPSFRSYNYNFDVIDHTARGDKRSFMLSLVMPSNEQPANYKIYTQRCMLEIKNMNNISDAIYGDSKDRLFKCLKDTWNQISHERLSRIKLDQPEFPIPKVICSDFFMNYINSEQAHSEINNIIHLLKGFVELIPISQKLEIIFEEEDQNLNKNDKIIDNELYSPSFNNENRVFQDEMFHLSGDFNENLSSIDGFILENENPIFKFDKSPLDGKKTKDSLESPRQFNIKDMEENNSLPKNNSSEDIFPSLNEIKIRDPEHWENFLMRIFIIADFRSIKRVPSIEKLIEFHTKNKLLFMSFDEKKMEDLESVLSKITKISIEMLIEEYERKILSLIRKDPKIENHVEVLKYVVDFFKDQISEAERKFFLREIEQFKRGNLPLSPLIYILKEWFVRFNEDYLQEQSYFNPFPRELAFRYKFRDEISQIMQEKQDGEISKEIILENSQNQKEV